MSYVIAQHLNAQYIRSWGQGFIGTIFGCLSYTSPFILHCASGTDWSIACSTHCLAHGQDVISIGRFNLVEPCEGPFLICHPLATCGGQNNHTSWPSKIWQDIPETSQEAALLHLWACENFAKVTQSHKSEITTLVHTWCDLPAAYDSFSHPLVDFSWNPTSSLVSD